MKPLSFLTPFLINVICRFSAKLPSKRMKGKFVPFLTVGVCWVLVFFFTADVLTLCFAFCLPCHSELLAATICPVLIPSVNMSFGMFCCLLWALTFSNAFCLVFF